MHTRDRTKLPSFGVAGTKKWEFCREHTKEGMVSGSMTSRVWGTNAGSASAVPPTGSSGSPAAFPTGVGGGSTSKTSASLRQAASGVGTDRAARHSLAPRRSRRGRSAVGEGRSGGADDTDNRAGRHRSPAPSPGIPVSAEEPGVLIAEISSAPPCLGPPAEGDGTSRAGIIVKAEEGSVSSGVADAGEDFAGEEGGTDRGVRVGATSGRAAPRHRPRRKTPALPHRTTTGAAAAAAAGGVANGPMRMLTTMWLSWGRAPKQQRLEQPRGWPIRGLGRASRSNRGLERLRVTWASNL